MSSLSWLGCVSVAAVPSSCPSSHKSSACGMILTCHSALRTQVTKACDSPHHGSALRSVVSLVVALAMTIGVQGAPSSRDTFEDVPQTLSGGEKGQRIQKPKSAKAETCTTKCVSTCIRGGAGSGEGPLNVRRPLVVFKEGFRTRQYCLVECSEICNIIGDGDDGP